MLGSPITIVDADIFCGVCVFNATRDTAWLVDSLNKCVIINQFQIRGTIEHYYFGCKISSPSITIPTIAKTINIAYFIPTQWRCGTIFLNFLNFDNSPVLLGSRSDPRGSRLQPCLLYTSPSPRDGLLSRMPSSA